MFEVGEYIMYGHNGICKVEDITHLDLPGADKKKLYYVLVPQKARGSRVYFPVDKEQGSARRIISEEEAWSLLDEIADIPMIWIENEKFREASYKRAVYSGDCRQWVAIIKTLYKRKKERLARGKRIASIDERYLKMAEESLYTEIAFVIGKSKAEMEAFIIEHMGTREKEKAAL